MRKQLCFKLCTPVGHNIQGHTEPRDPRLEERRSDTFCGDVSQWGCFHPPGGSVNTCQQVTKGRCERLTMRHRWRQGADNVDVHRLESGCRHIERTRGRLGVSVDLRFLTSHAVTHPLVDITAHVRPEISGGQQTSRAFTTRVGEVVEPAENCAAAGRWDEWAR